MLLRRPALLLISALGLVTSAPACPDEPDPIASEQDNTPIDTAMRFANMANSDIDLYWVDHSANEVAMGSLHAQEELNIGSFVGHVWVARMSATQEFAFRFRTQKGDKCCHDCGYGNGEMNPAGECLIEIPGCGEDRPVAQAEVGADGSIQAQAPFPPFRSKMPRRRDPNAVVGLSSLNSEEAAKASNCPELEEWVMRSMQWPGYHPLCFYKSPTNETMYEIMAFVHGVASPDSHVKFAEIPVDSSVRTFRRTIEDLLPIHRTDQALLQGKKTMKWTPQQWAAFNTGGEPVKKMAGAGVMIVFEGGQWIHPGIEIGFKRNIRAHDSDVVLETLSLQPLVFGVQNFIKLEECEHIQAQSAPHVAASGVSLMDRDEGAPATDFRTSKTYFLRSADELLKNFDQRVANLTRVPVGHQEDLQVLKYDKNGRYDQHLDFWDPKSYTDQGVVSMSQEWRAVTGVMQLVMRNAARGLSARTCCTPSPPRSLSLSLLSLSLSLSLSLCFSHSCPNVSFLLFSAPFFRLSARLPLPSFVGGYDPRRLQESYGHCLLLPQRNHRWIHRIPARLRHQRCGD
jgi:hypothetical protein